LAERLAAFLGTKRLLLVLDNFEQVLPAAPEIAALLAACPWISALVTSRTVLNVTGEHDLRVPPLALPESIAVHAAQLLGVEAIRLFVTRATAARDDFTLTEGNAADVIAICRRVDGLPLALELAAARIAHLPPAALRARLDQQLTLLAGGPQDQPARLRSMRDAIAWSFDLLPAVEQDLFLRLTVFVGGCTLETAEAVCGDNPGIDILTGLASLVCGKRRGQAASRAS
jgi:predicted ATPase